MVTCSGLERKLPCTVTPEPMLTRSSDWVEFALIYENNLDSVKNISEELDAYGPFSIKKRPGSHTECSITGVLCFQSRECVILFTHSDMEEAGFSIKDYQISRRDEASTRKHWREEMYPSRESF